MATKKTGTRKRSSKSPAKKKAAKKSRSKMVARAKVTAAVALACKVARSRFVSDAPDEIARRCAAADEPDIAAIAAEVLAVEVDRYAADMDQAAK